MKQHELIPAPGSRKQRKRVGRGDGSGHGSYSGHGLKGQKARSGGSIPPYFEGGQLPLVKRLPKKRGFVNIFKTEYEIINLEELNRFESGTEVDAEKLVAAGLVKSSRRPLKVLGDGSLRHPLVVKAQRFSGSARQKIEAAGGRAEELS